ncbi:DMT family transporter [Bacillus sp. FJAT-45037]|uniref:DMT family transporter n=1 Tax=Bacillus sp. FJAT-45037 TaxID=2011007 RepID=UPI001E526574|nr:DMT family transporter [Bacillus sp. FJAT-45037]
MKNKLWPIYLMLTISTAIWGSAFIAGKFAIESFEPATIAFLRFFGAALLLFPIMWIVERNRPKPSLKDWGMFSLLGVTGIAIYNICFFLASKHAPVIKSSLFIAANPMLIVLLSAVFLKEAISRKQIIGLVLALSGVVVIVTEGNLHILTQFRFEAIDLVLGIAVITWALYSVLGRVVLKKFSPIVSTTYAVGFGTLFLLPFSLLERPMNAVLHATPIAWFSIVHMSVFVTVVSFIMYYYGIQQIGAARASIFINVMPVSAVIMATLFLGEEFTAAYGIGAFLVLTGVYVGTYVRKVRQKQPRHAS